MSGLMRALVAAFPLAAMAACSGEADGPVFLIGKWQGNGEVYVLSRGGALERLDAEGKSLGSGVWSVQGDELRLRIDPAVNAVCEFSVDNVTLSLIPSDRCTLASTSLRRIAN